ncbi:MAG: hypothetical protein JW951_09675, partial [Lentisphaerae bacterium]|nr:hypothetical protein [Lentisphaerota bacterium]
DGNYGEALLNIGRVGVSGTTAGFFLFEIPKHVDPASITNASLMIRGLRDNDPQFGLDLDGLGYVAGAAEQPEGENWFYDDTIGSGTDTRTGDDLGTNIGSNQVSLVKASMFDNSPLVHANQTVADASLREYLELVTTYINDDSSVTSNAYVVFRLTAQTNLSAISTAQRWNANTDHNAVVTTWPTLQFEYDVLPQIELIAYSNTTEECFLQTEDGTDGAYDDTTVNVGRVGLSGTTAGFLLFAIPKRIDPDSVTGASLMIRALRQNGNEPTFALDLHGLGYVVGDAALPAGQDWFYDNTAGGMDTRDGDTLETNIGSHPVSLVQASMFDNDPLTHGNQTTTSAALEAFIKLVAATVNTDYDISPSSPAYAVFRLTAQADLSTIEDALRWYFITDHAAANAPLLQFEYAELPVAGTVIILH